jgi:urease accessory protein
MNTDASSQLLYLLQVANASFPTGAFNHSYGFETWIDSGAIDDAAAFDIACRDWLQYGVATADGAAVAHAHRFASQSDLAALIDLDLVVGALKLSREAREASHKTGRALMVALADIFAVSDLEAFATAIRDGRCEGHQAVIFGAAAQAHNVGERDAVLAFLQTTLSNLTGVGARLIPLGQVETQRIVKNAWPLLQSLAEEACAMEVDQLGTASAGLDVASMQHERLHTRLCMS